MTSAPPPLPPAPPSWFARNWYWVVPAGALAGAIAAGALFVSFWGLGRVLKESDIYIVSMQAVRESATVREMVGTPIADSWLVNGELTYSSKGIRANFVIPISGPKGKAMVKVIAAGHAPDFEYEQFVVEVPSTPPARIDLNPRHSGR